MDICSGIILPDDFALIVAGAPKGAPVSLLAPLVDAASTVIAADAGADALRLAFLPYDVLVGDLDSVTDRTCELARLDGKRIIQVPTQKDFTDLELALDTARQLGKQRVVISGVSGGRIDHELAVIGTCTAASDLHPLIIDESAVIQILSSDERLDHLRLGDIGLEVADEFSVIATEPESVVTLSGVEYPLESGTLPPLAGLGVSNVVVERDASVTCERGTVLVIRTDASKGR